MTARRSARAPLRPGPPVHAGATIHAHRLRNGLRVLLLERHHAPVVATMLWYRVGSRNEREHEAGASHFLEHMMFKGSERYGKGEVDRLTAVLGGSNNAFTTPDHTAYWFEFASDRWEAALDLEVDRMRALALDPGEFESEKAVVLEELAMTADDPWRNLMRQVQEVVFPRHPYRRPVIGYADVLERMTPDLLRGYYRRFYHPANATLLVCGDLKPAAALRAVRARFAGLPAGMPYAEADFARPAACEPRGERRLLTHWDDPAPRVCMAYAGAAFGSDDDFALDLLVALLSVGRLSRLHRRLVLERGLATSVGAHNDARVDGGALWIQAEGVPGGDAAELERALDVELERISRELVPAAELARARSTLAASEDHETEGASDLAEGFGGYAVDARWELALEVRERRARVRPRELRELARRVLSPQGRVVGLSLPKGERAR